MSKALDDFVRRLEAGQVLNSQEATEAMRIVADGRASTPQIVRLLRAYNRRPPTVEELVAFVTVLRSLAVPVHAPAPNTICNCGTGGDGRGSVNISTIAAFVIAACGVPVAKHGNRSVSSRCGSTDCLTKLGVRVSADPADAEALLGETGLCFMNAPDFHPAMRRVSRARRELARRGAKTIFNLLGPMLNPARVRRQSMGVFAENAVQPVAEVLARTGTERAYVFCGDGYDELAVTGPTRLATVTGRAVSLETVEPETLGLAGCHPAAVQGGEPDANARIAEEILRGRQAAGVADMVVLNAAAGVSAGMGPDMDIRAALPIAREALASGRAYELLQTMRRKAPAHA